MNLKVAMVLVLAIPSGAFVAHTPAGAAIGAVTVVSKQVNFSTVVQETAPGINSSGQSFWYLILRNDGTVARTIAIFALCASPLAGYQLMRTDFPLAAFGWIINSTRCPVGKTVLAGGALVVGAGLGNFNTVVREMAPMTVNRGEQDIWMTSFRNHSGVARTAAIMAVCAFEPQGYQLVRTDAPMT